MRKLLFILLVVIANSIQAHVAYVKVIAPDGSESWTEATGTLDGTEFSIGKTVSKEPAISWSTKGVVDLSQCNSAADGSGTVYTVVTINKHAFYGLGISSVIIPNTVTLIQTEAFYKCTALEKIHIPSSVESIYTQAFRDCIALKDITIDEGLKNLETSVFYKCESLETIKLPKSLERMGSATFLGCTSLKSIEIPSGVKSIGSELFGECI